MYELSNSSLKRMTKEHQVALSSEKIAAFGLVVAGITTITFSKIYSYVGYTAFDGTFSKQAPYTQFSESYVLGACLYMPVWYAAVSSLFISAKDRMALQKYNPLIKDSQNKNEQTIFRRAIWNLCVIPDKLGTNTWVGLIANPCLGVINGALITAIGAKLKGIDNQTASDMAILGAASSCLSSTVATSLILFGKYYLTDNKPTFLPVFTTNDEVSDCDSESDLDATSEKDSVENDRDNEDETILELLSRRSTEQDTLHAILWQNLKNADSPLVALVEEHNASREQRSDRPDLKKKRLNI